ncbi:MAG: hypothetical protein ACT4QB_08350, partial [Gammaproteobacteria bacterium]
MSAIPDFQRTRGALRFLAACLRACHRDGKSRAVLGPGDVPMHDDCFKKDPNVTLLVEQEADAVARDERRVRDRIKEMIEARLAGHRTAVIWPEKIADVPDKDASFLVAYLPLEVGGKPRTAQEAQAKEILEKYGDKPRQYRNGLGLAIPSADQIESLRRSVRYLMAVEQVKTKAKQHNLTDEQKGQLREREA